MDILKFFGLISTMLSIIPLQFSPRIKKRLNLLFGRIPSYCANMYTKFHNKERSNTQQTFNLSNSTMETPE